MREREVDPYVDLLFGALGKIRALLVEGAQRLRKERLRVLGGGAGFTGQEPGPGLIVVELGAGADREPCRRLAADPREESAGIAGAAGPLKLPGQDLAGRRPVPQAPAALRMIHGVLEPAQPGAQVPHFRGEDAPGVLPLEGRVCVPLRIGERLQHGAGRGEAAPRDELLGEARRVLHLPR